MENWTEKDGILTRIIKTDNYIQGVAHVVQIASLAEDQKHHPTIVLEYGRVIVSLTTHDAGNTVTEKDYRLAKSIDECF